MPDFTVRYHAESRLAYARALRELAIYAREHSDDYEDVSVFSRVDAQLADTTAFMREHGLVHFDAHFLTS